MKKRKKFAILNIRKISGGKDPVRIVEDFIDGQSFEPEKCLQHKSNDNARWMLPISQHEELEILVENLRSPADTTIYMGVNVLAVPVRGSCDVLAAALQIADGLVGIKVSLVGHYLVLSSSLAAGGTTPEDLERNFTLITAQQQWFRDTLLQELGWQSFPEE